MSRKSSKRLAPTGLRTEVGAFLRMCEGVNTPRSIACYMLVVAGEFDQYLDLDFPDPESISFKDDYACTAMLSKNPNLPTSHDRRETAREKWYEAEELCRVQNWRWKEFADNPLGSDISLPIVLAIRNEIQRILGPAPSKRDLHMVVENTRFGSGSTSSVKGALVLPSRKYTSKWDVSPSLLPYCSNFVPRLTATTMDGVDGFTSTWSAPTGDVIDYNTVDFVPKNSKTDRAIAIEPHMNIFVQLGIGHVLRQKLKRVGIDISVQEGVNREHVRQAQKLGLATIDLSSASDTIASLTVLELFPLPWVHLLDIARVTNSRVPLAGLESEYDLVHLEKFSAMGNGYTFELETLLFYAICKVAGTHRPQVYGDDMIVSQEYALNTINILEMLGFKVNKAKTFLAGRFYESCGVDVHDGQDCRPLYLKGVYEDEVDAVIKIANKIRRYAALRNSSYGYDKRFQRAWLYCTRRKPECWNTAAPFGGDIQGLWLEWDEALPIITTPQNWQRKTAKKKKERDLMDGWCGYVGFSRSYGAVRSPNTHILGAYILALYTGTGEISHRRESIRGARSEHSKVRPIIYTKWDNLGGWC